MLASDRVLSSLSNSIALTIALQQKRSRPRLPYFIGFKSHESFVKNRKIVIQTSRYSPGL